MEKTAASKVSVMVIAVHLHACGEDLRADNTSAKATGSPPRVWRRSDITLDFLTSLRFTSTRVEKIDRLLYLRVPSAVHLHACGED